MESLEQESLAKKFEQFRNLERLVIFTTTKYGADKQSLVRQELGLKLLKNADTLGVRVVVVDGGSNASFLSEARTFKNVTVLAEKKDTSMGEGRRQALHEALKFTDADTFFWVEPEKDALITERSLGDMITEINTKRADIIVPRREEKKTLPEFQRWIETRANKKADSLMGVTSRTPEDEIDLWFGPKMFTRDAAHFFSDYTNPIDKWDSTIKPVIDAYNAGVRIASVPVNYQYDPTQRAAEEGDRPMKAKRIDQYRQIFAALGNTFWSQENKGLLRGGLKKTELKSKK